MDETEQVFEQWRQAADALSAALQVVVEQLAAIFAPILARWKKMVNDARRVLGLSYWQPVPVEATVVHYRPYAIMRR